MDMPRVKGRNYSSPPVNLFQLAEQMSAARRGEAPQPPRSPQTTTSTNSRNFRLGVLMNPNNRPAQQQGPVCVTPDKWLREQVDRVVSAVVVEMERLIKTKTKTPSLPTADVPQEAADNPVASKKRKTADVVPTPLNERRWLTIKEAASLFPFSEGAIRHLVFSAEGTAKFPKSGLRANGFIDCIYRPPGQRRVFLDRVALINWVASGSGAQK